MKRRGFRLLPFVAMTVSQVAMTVSQIDVT